MNLYDANDSGAVLVSGDAGLAIRLDASWLCMCDPSRPRPVTAWQVIATWADGEAVGDWIVPATMTADDAMADLVFPLRARLDGSPDDCPGFLPGLPPLMAGDLWCAVCDTVLPLVESLRQLGGAS